MFEHHITLFKQARWRRQRLTSGQCSSLRENPRVSNRPASNRYTIDSGAMNHFQAIMRREQIAAAEYRSLGADVPFDLRQKLPATRANITLQDGPAVNGDGSDARGKCPIEDGEELVPALGCVVD